jgi:hypothetical protein
VNLADFFEAFINVGDFRRQQKTYFRAAGFGNFGSGGSGKFFLQLEQPLFRRRQLFLHFIQPTRMREIAGANDGHALELRPFAEVLEIKLLAGGAGEVRVEVQVGDKLHDMILYFSSKGMLRNAGENCKEKISSCSIPSFYVNSIYSTATQLLAFISDNNSPSGRFGAGMAVLLQRVCSNHEASGRLREQLPFHAKDCMENS